MVHPVRDPGSEAGVTGRGIGMTMAQSAMVIPILELSFRA